MATMEHRPEPMARQAEQKMEETAAERKTRKLADFATIEKKMPILNRRKGSIVDKLSSHLGKRNPLAKAVTAKDNTVWLMDNTAWPGRYGTWKVEEVVAYFEKDSGDDSSEAVATLSEILGLAHGDAARDTVAQRLQPFLDCVVPARTVTLDIGSQKKKLGPSNSDGISSDEVTISGKFSAGEAVEPKLVELQSETPAKTYFAAETGWAVISDIDDTIKKTMTASATGILKTTFVDDPEPIAGMPELYQHMHKVLDFPPFWYLSASPYNLYFFLRQFRDTANYPPGQLILRDASWMNLAGFLASITQGTQSYKVDRIKKIHRWFPKRTFICIGDSTQSDPETYGEIYRAFPGWIKGIFIRRVTGVAGVEMDKKEKNDPERFTKAFDKVPEDVWYVFDDAKELYAKVDALVAGGL
jgi:phosphatidate phosphatase APP1